MEQWRLFLAIFLSILVFAVWQYFFVPQHEGELPSLPAEQSAKHPKTESLTEAPSGGPSMPEGEPFEIKTIQTPLYTARISAKGAAFTSFVLRHYKERLDDPHLGKQLIPDTNRMGSAWVAFGGTYPPDLGSLGFTADYAGDTMEVRDAAGSISFFTRSAEGLAIEKKYTFYPDSYKIDLTVMVSNESDQPKTGSLALVLTNPPPENNSSYGFEGAFAYINRSFEQIQIKEFEKKGILTGPIDWAGIETQYFMSVMLPESPSENRLRCRYHDAAQLVEVWLMGPEQQIRPEGQVRGAYTLFFGPKRMADLKTVGRNLEQAVHFGFFDIIAKPCLWLMNLIHDRVIPNYGVCIIILTILFKIIFWPLGTKSYKSMAEMKKLQPLMEEIRKKYKEDKKKMNEEIMGLYRTYKVNPMSGCLPMLVQIPVFIAFYRMLYGAIELRHAPFALWINDLSSPDRLFHFGFSIPLMAPPAGIPVLTIIMGATMVLQQKLSPPPGDPAQAKMMMLLPIIFTVIFINFPSGLVLYWLVNNILSIAQQYYITKKIV